MEMMGSQMTFCAHRGGLRRERAERLRLQGRQRRRSVAAEMSEREIAAPQRVARDWLVPLNVAGTICLKCALFFDKPEAP
jgi:hypothetical protein